ncbi:hypothetical protein pb186bvf_016384 [Paramecium bursaria]
MNFNLIRNRSEMIIDLQNNLECPVCLDTLLNPVIEQGTQHIFCFKCVQNIESCPLCRKEDFQATPYEIKELINLNFKCCDCEQIHPYAQFDNHYQKCQGYCKKLENQVQQLSSQIKDICQLKFDGHLKECHQEIYDSYVQDWNYLSINPKEWQWWWWSNNPWWANKGCEHCQAIYDVEKKQIDQIDKWRRHSLNELTQINQ